MVGASAHAKTLTPADLRNFIGRRLIDRLDSDTARHVCQALLIPTPKERNYGGRDYGAGITKYLASLKDDQLGAFLIALTAAPTINGGSWGVNLFTPATKRLKVNERTIAARVRKAAESKPAKKGKK